MPDRDVQFWFAASSEEFPPSQMLEQASAAEQAGFDGTASSDHFAPWFPDGQGSHAWVFLGAGSGEAFCDADPLGSIRRYGAEVLPELRGARV